MNPEMLIDFQNRLVTVEESVEDILKTVKQLKIDSGLKLNANVDIPPGISCKIAYDKNGLVLKGDKLNASDIPKLEIDGINNLRNILDGKVSKRDLQTMQMTVGGDDKPEQVVATGIKINYDKNGRIVSSSGLTAEDIPTLEIKHIQGLIDQLEILKSISIPIPVEKEYKINPGTFPKITFDEKGRVVSGRKLVIDDIPMELISSMNELESKIPSLASQRSVDALNKTITTKLDGNESIKPGTYTKLSVDSKGLIIQGENLTLKDLPDIGVSDIIGLQLALNSKANQKDLVELYQTVTSVSSSLNKVGDVVAIQNAVKTKAEDSEVKELSSRVKSIQSLIDTLNLKTPNDLIMDQLQQIQNELSSLSGRVYTIEKKMGIETAFDHE